MTLETYSWLFLIGYIGLMIWLGVLGTRRVKNADDFATARGSYGPVFLALAFTSTVASGATFLGIPGLAYTNGLSAMWIMFLYVLGAYTGVLICQRTIARMGAEYGSRSIAEFLGERYQSDAMRILVALFSLILMFYLAGQLVSGVVMFETMLGLSLPWALLITSAVLLGYIVTGGAHADMLTDGVQGAVMLILALFVLVLFLIGFGVEGGLGDVIDRLATLDHQNVSVLHEGSVVVGEWWHVFALFFVHIPLGLLPHVGNKLWALRSESDRTKFVMIAFVFGMILPCIAFGGILARALFADDLFAASGGANSAVPELFIALFPVWLAALLGVAILAAIMSTADGLVIAMGQVVANDLYRLTFAPKWHAAKSEAEVDKLVLGISRVATALFLLSAVGIAYLTRDMNISLLVAIGFGGMAAAVMGPLVLGVVWRGVTLRGALAGFVTGAGVFIVIAAGLLPEADGSQTLISELLTWLDRQRPNAFSVGALGAVLCLLVTFVVSLLDPQASQGSGSVVEET